jgi:hypothetical protein
MKIYALAKAKHEAQQMVGHKRSEILNTEISVKQKQVYITS